MDDGLHVTLRQHAPIPLDLAFSCAGGELLAIIGPSGAGKTTLLRCIAGLHRPAAGRITCGGATWFDRATSINLPTHRRPVGLVFQSYALFPHMTAAGNVATALRHLPPAARADRVASLLATVHLDGLANRRPAELSGGQQQRVALARALARDPAVLLLDEPFSAVDRPTRRKLHADLQRLRLALAIPIVLVTHDTDEAASLADRFCVLDRGAILQIGTPAEVLDHPASRRVAEIMDVEEPS